MLALLLRLIRLRRLLLHRRPLLRRLNVSVVGTPPLPRRRGSSNRSAIGWRWSPASTPRCSDAGADRAARVLARRRGILRGPSAGWDAFFTISGFHVD